MDPIIPTWIIYAISTLIGLRILAIISATTGFLAMIFIVSFYYFDCLNTEQEEWIKEHNLFKKGVIWILISSLLAVFIPSKEIMYVMLANSFITPDNLEIVGNNITGLIDYILVKISELSIGG